MNSPMNIFGKDILSVIWDLKSKINRLPFLYSIYQASLQYLIPDGLNLSIPFGPGAGLRWRHYKAYQPWMALGLYEPPVAWFIANQLRAGDVFYDIGANAGYYSVIAARKVGPLGRVISFDPVPLNVKVIQEQVTINHMNDICLVEPFAVSDQCGQANFLISKRNPNSHLLEKPAPHVSNNRGEVIEVQCITLDHYIKTHIQPTWVKIDIEGAEVSALVGAKELLMKEKAPKFLVSVHSDMLERQVTDIFQSAGFTVINLEGFKQMVYAHKPV